MTVRIKLTESVDARNARLQARLDAARRAPLVLTFPTPDGKRVEMAFSREGAALWCMSVTSPDGGAVFWSATPQEMTAWVIGRRYMALWAAAHETASRAHAERIADAAAAMGVLE